MNESFVDGAGPFEMLRPVDVVELGELVRRAAADNFALFPRGGGTKLDLGAPPDRPGMIVDLTRMDQVIDYPARDMTITVQTGIRVARLQEILAGENQRLPIDVARASEATLGGILACNSSGPRRLGFGTLRDYLLGFSAVNDDGNDFKAGGRVVKNVAGYDLAKLMIGALGTLGILTQATLKLRPLPEESALVALECTSAQLPSLLEQIHNSRTQPVCLEVLNQPCVHALLAPTGLMIPELDWTIVLGLEGSSEAVHWQVQQLMREFGVGIPLEVRVGFTARALWNALVEYPAWPQAETSFQANLLPSGVAEFCRTVTTAAPEVLLLAHAGSGIVLGHYPAGLGQDKTLDLLRCWRAQAAKHQGQVTMTRCPPAWKTAEFVWGPPAAHHFLLQGVKNKFDPRRLFNPGRFLGGL